MIVEENSDKLINKHPGGCVCGSLRYEVSGEPERIIVCHCHFCQRRTGSAFAIIPMFEKKHVLFNEGEKKFLDPSQMNMEGGLIYNFALIAVQMLVSL